jgi:hypothetical protein
MNPASRNNNKGKGKSKKEEKDRQIESIDGGSSGEEVLEEWILNTPDWEEKVWELDLEFKEEIKEMAKQDFSDGEVIWKPLNLEAKIEQTSKELKEYKEALSMKTYSEDDDVKPEIKVLIEEGYQDTTLMTSKFFEEIAKHNNPKIKTASAKIIDKLKEGLGKIEEEGFKLKVKADSIIFKLIIITL